MKIEHVAFQVHDPAAMARWYVTHLGMIVKRSQPHSPFGHFLADSDQRVMIEIYCNPAVAVPDYTRIDPLLLHLAFTADDLPAARARLIAAGATAEGEVTETPMGDIVAMLRDPWGLAIQLVHRATPMI